MLKAAVIGKDVSKSQSPSMHAFILKGMGEEVIYEKRSIKPENFPLEAKALFAEYDALNVTIPFKQEIIPFLNGLYGDAKAFGAVNTVLCGSKKGYNTDGYGFMLMLQNAGIAVRDKEILLLGAGGAGRSCIKKLTEAGAEVAVYERDGARLLKVREEFEFTPLKYVPLKKFDIILNCTGIGMHDTVGKTPTVRFESKEKPVDEELLSLCDTAVDLIYEPAQSEFLRIAQSVNKQTLNGEAMLFYQAYMSDCIFLNRQPNAEEAKALRKAYTEEIK